VLEAVESVLEQELTEALGSVRYERSPARQGYRNGHERRRITSAVGTQELDALCISLIVNSCFAPS
jgi:putative transposase